MNYNTRILCNWAPNALDLLLSEKFKNKVKELEFIPDYIDVRSPELNAVWADTSWHQDSSSSSDSPTIKFIIWSNVRPVEVKFMDDSLLHTFPGDMIFINNDEVLHKAPLDQSGRWTVSGIVR